MHKGLKLYILYDQSRRISKQKKKYCVSVRIVNINNTLSKRVGWPKIKIARRLAARNVIGKVIVR